MGNSFSPVGSVLGDVGIGPTGGAALLDMDWGPPKNIEDKACPEPADKLYLDREPNSHLCSSYPPASLNT
jgi:hypothetical protein